MAKLIMTASSDFSELTKDLLLLAEDIPHLIQKAAEAQFQVLERQIKSNWVSLVPHGRMGDYVYDSIGYNIEPSKKDKEGAVGMVGVFLVDSVGAKHGKNTPIIKKNGFSKEQMRAPNLAYWAEYGWYQGAKYHEGVPFIANANHATMDEQQETFNDVLQQGINERMKK